MDDAPSISKPSEADAPLEQYSLGQAIVLHLLPGAIATVVYIVTVPFLTGLGYPSITALYLPMIVAVMIVELGYLFYRGQRENGIYSLKGVVNYRQPVPLRVYIVFPVIILIWGIIVTGLVSPVDNLLLNQIFKWLPDWYALRNILQIKTMYSSEALLISAAAAAVTRSALSCTRCGSARSNGDSTCSGRT